MMKRLVCVFLYKDAWYYVCKHRKLIDGQKCTYRRQPPQGPIDKEVTAIVGQATVSQDLLYAMYWYSNQKTDTKELEKRLAELEKIRAQKTRAKDRLSSEMDSLDAADDETYDMLYSDLVTRQKGIYTEIANLDKQIQNIKADIQKQSDAEVTVQMAHQLLLDLGEKLQDDSVSDADKKRVLQAMVEKVELFPERLEMAGTSKELPLSSL